VLKSHLPANIFFCQTRIAQFRDKIDFREAFFDSSAQVDFGGAKIVDTLLIGNLESEILQSFDFNLTQLLPTGEYYNKVRIRSVRNDTIFIRGEVMPLSGAGAIILLHGPVHMRIQFEQLPFVKLPEKLGYFTKNFIIDGTKQASFRGDEYKRERFELDYLLDKSTKYQIQSTGYKKYSLFHPVAWWRFVYDATLGLGYRPFRLVWWVIAVILIFALCYFFTMSNEINRYLTEGQITKSAKENGKDHPLDRFINCIYFSSMVFFTFRLKRDILTTFANKQKWTIVGQWLIGFLILIGFLTLSKSGSILHTLKSLFVG